MLFVLYVIAVKTYDLIPSTRKSVCEVIKVAPEFLAYFVVHRVHLRRNVGGHHHQVVHLTGNVGIRRLWRIRISRRLLYRISWTLYLLPVEFEQIFQVVIVPLCRVSWIPLPKPTGLYQPKPCAWMGATSGAAPILSGTTMP